MICLPLTRPHGLPIGNLTSQFWANVYLNPFDHFVKRELRCKGYLRYVDDFCLFAMDQRTLWSWKAAVEQKLGAVRLRIHPCARQIRDRYPKGFPFLGFMVFPKTPPETQKRDILSEEVKSFAGGLREQGEIPLEEVHASVQGWVNHVRYGNTVGLRKALLSHTTFPAFMRK